jgi:hypothetical protein
MTNPSLLADSPLPLSAWAFLLRAFRDTDQPERRRFLVDLFLLVARGLRNASPAADPADSALFLFLWPFRKYAALKKFQRKILEEELGEDWKSIEKQIGHEIFMGFQELGCRTALWDGSA